MSMILPKATKKEVVQTTTEKWILSIPRGSTVIEVQRVMDQLPQYGHFEWALEDEDENVKLQVVIEDRRIIELTA